MSDVVTFFATNQAQAGGRYAFNEPGGGLLLVFTPAPLGAEALGAPADKEGRRPHMKQALEDGGGLRIQTRPGEGRTRVWVKGFPAANYAPPDQILLLSHVPEPRLVRADGELDVMLGDHLIVPVDRGSQADLINLRELLRGLPPDTESVMLSVLRRPSLEAAVTRLQRDVRALGKAGRRTTWIVGAASAAAVAAVTASVIHVLVQRPPTTQQKDQDAAADTTGTQTTATPTTTQPTSTATQTTAAATALEEKPKASFDTSIRELYKAVEASANDRIRILHQQHFSAPLPLGKKSEGAVWGLVKLALLATKTQMDNDDLLAEHYRIARANLPKLKPHQDLMTALAFASCQTSPKPELPGPFAFSTKPCDEVTKDETSAAAGINNLIDYVITLPR